MLNLPSPHAVLPPDLAVPAQPTEMLPVAGPPLPGFAGLLAASGTVLPAAGGTVDSVSGEIEIAESPAIAQAWAVVLVPELASLPAEFAPPVSPHPAALPDPETGAAAGDMLGRGAAVLNFGLAGPWPMRAAASPRLAGLAPAADPGRVRGWQNGVPSAPAIPSPSITATAPPADFILRNVTGQPIPFPTADQPPWYDPTQAPPWFDSANPPPPWSDPTRPPPLWYDPTQVPPAWLDPARVPAAWFDSVRPPAVAISALVEARPDSSPTLALAIVQAEASPPAAQRAAFDEQPVLAERAQPALTAPTFTLAAPPPALAVLATSQALAAAPPPSPHFAPAVAETNPALTIASDRLGDIAVRLSGGPDQLQVSMQAQPAAAALIGADAPRLSQDLAAAGVALAGLSVNGQRADLNGGQRDRQRQSARRDDTAPIAVARRPAARASATRSALTIDRFA